MARYQIMEGEEFVGGHLLEWGGLFIHTGIQTSSFKGQLSQDFDDEQVVVSGQTATFSNATAQIDLESSSTSIPIEVSTYIRAAWILTISAGAGFDFVTSESDVDINASGVANTAGNTFIADIAANENESGEGELTNGRAFLAFQLNLPAFRFFVHANQSITSEQLGVNTGVKILW